jgi:hypothetical protein
MQNRNTRGLVLCVYVQDGGSGAFGGSYKTDGVNEDNFFFCQRK